MTWKDAGIGIRAVFSKLTRDVELKTDTRVTKVSVLPDGRKRVLDENDVARDVDRVIFACPSNAVGNILHGHGSCVRAARCWFGFCVNATAGSVQSL